MKIHFLLVKDLFKGGGVETYTRGVGRSLVRRGHEVTVYSTGGVDKPATWEGINVVWLPKVRPYWAEKFCGAAMAAYREMKAGDADIIHLHSVAAGCMGALLRYRSAPCVVQMHGVEWLRSRWSGVARGVLKTMERFSIASADALTAVSKTQCDYYAANYRRTCQYIPTAVDVKELTSPQLILELGLRPREYVLFAARLVPEKGLHYLIPAFRRLETNCTLVIAGGESGSPAYQQELIRLADDDPRIRFLGDVRGRLLDELFSNARVFVLPSELEGLSIGLIEAMSYGLPCVASDIPENLEVIGDVGFQFQSKNTNDLCRVLDGALRKGTVETERICSRARRRVEELFCWELVVDQLESLYRGLLADPKRQVAPFGHSVKKAGVAR